MSTFVLDGQTDTRASVAHASGMIWTNMAATLPPQLAYVGFHFVSHSALCYQFQFLPACWVPTSTPQSNLDINKHFAHTEWSEPPALSFTVPCSFFFIIIIDFHCRELACVQSLHFLFVWYCQCWALGACCCTMWQSSVLCANEACCICWYIWQRRSHWKLLEMAGTAQFDYMYIHNLTMSCCPWNDLSSHWHHKQPISSSSLMHMIALTGKERNKIRKMCFCQ